MTKTTSKTWKKEEKK